MSLQCCRRLMQGRTPLLTVYNAPPPHNAPQMVSLLHLADITEEGVTFQSPIDGERMLLTPEHSMRIQNQLGAQRLTMPFAVHDVCTGADIMMALDDVVPSTTQDPARYAVMRWCSTRTRRSGLRRQPIGPPGGSTAASKPTAVLRSRASLPSCRGDLTPD